MRALLKVESLVKYFPIYSGIFRRHTADVQAVRGIDFSIQKGEVLGLVGESGCGKSTVARSVTRLIEPTSGTICFDGDNVLLFGKKELVQFRKEVQMIFQDPYSSLNPRKTVLESIGEALLFHKLAANKDEMQEQVKDVLEKVGLSERFYQSYPHELSGGQQQRVCIGRAIALRPKLLVCDEAVSSLDVSVQAQILNLLLKLKEELHLSYLFISHDLSVIRSLCDRVIVLYLGKVMEVGPVEQVFTSPCHPYTQALLSAIPKDVPGKRKTRILLKGEIPSPIYPPSGCPFRTRCPFAEPICATEPPVKSPSDDHFYHCIL